MKNIEDKNEGQPKTIWDKKEAQTRIINTSSVKLILFKNIYKQEVKDERIVTDKVKKDLNPWKYGG